MTTNELQKEFRNRFHKEQDAFFFCPGRVNLIGEHIDYNGGQVMPGAISLGTYLVVAKNQDKVFRFQCINFPEIAEIPLQDSYTKTGREWYNYPLGVIDHFLGEGHTLSGLDLLFYGNLPIGAGLSSSASIEVLTGFALSELFDIPVAPKDIAILSQKVENQFVGMNCGIMDQFAVAMGKTDHAILLNCDTLEYEYLPFSAGDHILAIINSRKERKLTDSKYNERRAECDRGLEMLQQEIDAANLCDITPAQFEKHRHLLNDAVLEKRVEHVVTENARVKEAAGVLKKGDLARFGELMFASHRSLQELYEVSGRELDTIVEFCKTFEGCTGARMTGAGFGGCAIALVKKDRYADFAAQLITYYKERIGYEPEVFASAIGNGVGEIG